MASAVASAGTDGVELGFMELWDCLTTMEFDITGLESTARLIGSIYFQMKLTEKA